MNSFKNIVVGLDISKSSLFVLKRAFLLAKNNNSKVTIVHAIDTNWFSELFSDSNLDELKEQALINIKEQIELIDTKGIEYSIEVDKEAASTYVVDTAVNIGADLIIIGANEKDDRKISLLGSTAHKIAQNFKLPLLIVKNPCENENYKKPVAFTDLSEVSLKSINFSRKFFKQEIKVVYIYKQISEIAFRYYNEFENKDKIQLGIKKKEEEKFKKFTNEHHFKDNELIEESFGLNDALLSYSTKNNNDLVVIGSNGVNYTGSFFYGSTASYLMENLKSDVLIYIPE
ncbi:hypothetical protein CP965_02795 [Halarcobacter mediterraneus]|uniref:UspA domain-containing protein n=1 Tax=Halarcobacter mediterraneus TaxID=2023153 RepID=A0A4Q1AYF3_9BACT|nr:universal stress protein [Halarcobacter mediterraneus]RXK14393.1 hypothetical protein CP965_02795 [Halarcobacter mediterraneus]